MPLIRGCLTDCLLVAALLVGCGGSADGVPVAVAGTDLRVEVATAVSLNGAASSDPEGKPLSYAWTITSAPEGSTAKLSSPSAPTASFTPDVDGSYLITLVVSDGGLSSAPATVTIVASLSPQAQADLVLARAAAVKAVLMASTGTIRLEWQDSFPEGTTYRVEAEDATGAFSEVETVPGGYGVPSVVLRSWNIPSNAVAYRVQAVLTGRSVPLRAIGSATRIVNRFTAEAIPQILIDPAEPSAIGRFSLNATRPFDKVTWSLNGLPMGDGGASVGNPLAHDFTRAASGLHQVAARVAVSSELSIDVQRDFRVANTMPLVNLAGGVVEASSASGIASVA